MVFPTYTVPVVFTCDKYGLDYNATFQNAVEEGCPFCNGRRPVPGHTSFAAKYPDVMKHEYDYINNYLMTNPDTVLETDLTKIWLYCPQGHHYQITYKDKSMAVKRNIESCSICKGYRRKKVHRYSNIE